LSKNGCILWYVKGTCDAVFYFIFTQLFYFIFQVDNVASPEEKRKILALPDCIMGVETYFSVASTSSHHALVVREKMDRKRNHIMILIIGHAREESHKSHSAQNPFGYLEGALGERAC
jgi:hypothetical protein